jgi:hypothetical protein
MEKVTVRFFNGKQKATVSHCFTTYQEALSFVLGIRVGVNEISKPEYIEAIFINGREV